MGGEKVSDQILKTKDLMRRKEGRNGGRKEGSYYLSFMYIKILLQKYLTNIALYLQKDLRFPLWDSV